MKTLLLYFALCALAALIPSGAEPPHYDPAVEDFPGWGAAPIPLQMTALAPGDREARFARDFPGKIGTFTDGERTYIVRWVRQATRKLHPAADCLRALGYEMHPGPVFAAADGTRWGTAQANHDNVHLRVRERIVDSVGREWTDVSAWYWHALFGQSCGPWWTVTLLEPAAK